MPISTGQFTLCAGFFDEPEVMELTWGVDRYSPAPIGAWVLMGSYHAAYPAWDVPYACRRLCGARPRDIKRLKDCGFLLDVGDGWRLGYAGYLWSITYGRGGNRAAIPDDVRAAVYERDGMACVLCGAIDDLTLDHITPWSHGGPDTITNLRVLCRSCNSSRGNRTEVHGG